MELVSLPGNLNQAVSSEGKATDTEFIWKGRGSSLNKLHIYIQERRPWSTARLSAFHSHRDISASFPHGKGSVPCSRGNCPPPQPSPRYPDWILAQNPKEINLSRYLDISKIIIVISDCLVFQIQAKLISFDRMQKLDALFLLPHWMIFAFKLRFLW